MIVSNGSGIEGYRAYLTRRDGDADLLHRRLASREEFFNGLEADPVRSARHIDRNMFLRNLRRRKPELGLDRRTLFLLATAKLNQAERFGVDLGDTYGRIGGEDEPPERLYLALEEHYHTRLLAYVADMFDLPFQVVVPPLVMSESASRSRVGVELFADEPEVAGRIDRLYSEILTDEVGHVGYCAASCTGPERAIMRWLYPRFGRLFARQTAEISLLTDPGKLRARLDEPFDVARLTAGLSNETFLAAHP